MTYIRTLPILEDMTPEAFAELQASPRFCTTCEMVKTWGDFKVSMQRGRRRHRSACQDCMNAYYVTKRKDSWLESVVYRIDKDWEYEPTMKELEAVIEYMRPTMPVEVPNDLYRYGRPDDDFGMAARRLTRSGGRVVRKRKH